ncbi:MAG: hypothetical protein NTX17_08000 [Candidatus Eisenbacteria bacterium]|nr:hypothetical protein [Candidatus Eisenbacteria bacterium]
MEARTFRSYAVAAMFIAAIFALALAAPKSEALMQKATLAQLAEGSTGIIQGQVTDITSQWDADGKTIFTYVTVTVDQWFKGTGSQTITIRVPGGEVDGVGLMVEDTPVFAKGQTVVTFVEPSEEQSVMKVKGLFQGKFTVENGKVREAGLPLGDFVQRVKSIVKAQEKRAQEK